MKYFIWLSTSLLLLTFFTESCYYDNEEDLYPMSECDTIAVTYSAVVLPIIRDNCYRCHDQTNNNAGVNVEGYAAINTYVANGSLLGAIQHASGYSPMPKDSPKLADCDINQIAAWINQGALNN